MRRQIVKNRDSSTKTVGREKDASTVSALSGERAKNDVAMHALSTIRNVYSLTRHENARQVQ